MILNLKEELTCMRHRQRLRKLVPASLSPINPESLLLVYSCLEILWGARYGGNTLHIELPPLMTATCAPFEVTLTCDPVRNQYCQPLSAVPSLHSSRNYIRPSVSNDFKSNFISKKTKQPFLKLFQLFRLYVFDLIVVFNGLCCNQLELDHLTNAFLALLYVHLSAS